MFSSDHSAIDGKIRPICCTCPSSFIEKGFFSDIWCQIIESLVCSKGTAFPICLIQFYQISCLALLLPHIVWALPKKGPSLCFFVFHYAPLQTFAMEILNCSLCSTVFLSPQSVSLYTLHKWKLRNEQKLYHWKGLKVWIRAEQNKYMSWSSPIPYGKIFCDETKVECLGRSASYYMHLKLLISSFQQINITVQHGVMLLYCLRTSVTSHNRSWGWSSNQQMIALISAIIQKKTASLPLIKKRFFIGLFFQCTTPIRLMFMQILC